MFNRSFSVVIPTCDRSSDLNNAIASVLKYAKNILEIIIIDNGLHTAKINHEDSRIRYIRTRSYIGSQFARNIGASLCQSEWILFLDDDDELCDYVINFDGVESVYDVILSSSVVYSGFEKVADRLVNKSSFSVNLLVHNPFAFSGTLIKANFYFSIGGMRQSLRSLQDWDLWLRLYKHKSNVLINSKIFSKINIDNQKRISTSNNFYLSYRRLVIENFGLYVSTLINPIYFKLAARVFYRLIKSLSA